MNIRDINLLSEVNFKTSRSGGSGGQNVNKLSTKVELNFNMAVSNILTKEQKDVLFIKLVHQINKKGILQIISQTERTQLGNKNQVIEKFYKLLEKAFFIHKKRKATKPSKSSKEKRLQTKKFDSVKKKLRQKNGNWQ